MQPNSLFIAFDTGMCCYLYAESVLKFDFNWLEGYELFSKPALKIYLENVTKIEESNIEALERHTETSQKRKQEG